MLNRRLLVSLTALLLCASSADAETLYVTDRILLGLHERPDASSQLVTSLPSGTSVEVVLKQDDFVQVKSEEGVTGWANAAFLMAKPPAQQLLNNLNQQHTQVAQERDKLRKELAQTEKALAEKEAELEKAQAQAQAPAPVQEEAEPKAEAAEQDSEELEAARLELETLRAKLEELQAAAQSAEEVTGPDPELITKLEQENKALRARIELALSNLTGEAAPAPEELAAIRPEFPLWYFAWIVVAAIVGFVIGALWLDYRQRSRLGGFRI